MIIDKIRFIFSFEIFFKHLLYVRYFVCALSSLYFTLLNNLVCNIFCCYCYHSDGQAEAQTGLEALRSSEVRLPARGEC